MNDVTTVPSRQRNVMVNAAAAAAGSVLLCACCTQLYRACGYTFLCYPLLLEVSDFYLSQDMEFVIDEVRVNWKYSYLFFYSCPFFHLQ